MVSCWCCPRPCGGPPAPSSTRAGWRTARPSTSGWPGTPRSAAWRGAPGCRARAGGGRWQERAERFFADHDVLITPALAQPPVEATAWARRGWFANIWSNARYAPFAAPWNLAGWPAMSVPAGLDPRGLPLAVQLVGRPGSEAVLLGVAAQLERLRPWPRTAPAR